MSEPRGMILSPEPMGSGGVPGAVVIDADCGHRAWISPAGLLAKLSGGLRTSCAECVPIDPELAVEAHPLVREELAGIMGSDLADALIAESQRRPADVLRANRRRRR